MDREKGKKKKIRIKRKEKRNKKEFEKKPQNGRRGVAGLSLDVRRRFAFSVDSPECRWRFAGVVPLSLSLSLAVCVCVSAMFVRE